MCALCVDVRFICNQTHKYQSKHIVKQQYKINKLFVKCVLHFLELFFYGVVVIIKALVIVNGSFLLCKFDCCNIYIHICRYMQNNPIKLPHYYNTTKLSKLIQYQ